MTRELLRLAAALSCVGGWGLVILLLAGCQSWHGPAEVTTKDGAVHRCPKGLTFRVAFVTCEGDGMVARIKWEHVAGYRTR